MTAEIIPFPDNAKSRTDPYFGGCPYCGNNDGFVNVERCHWFVCHAHKTTWLYGVNLFSGWRDEDDEVWQHNARMLDQ